MPVIDSYNTLRPAEGMSDDPFAEHNTLERLLVHMDMASVDSAVVCSPGQQIDNEYIAECQQLHPERIIGFATVNPRAGNAPEEVRRCAIKLGLRGVMLFPTLHGYHFVDHSLLDPIFAASGDLRMPIVVHAFDAPFATPLGIEEIARGFPRTQVIIAHIARVWNVDETLLVIRRNHNIFVETSSTQLREVQLAYQRIGAEKILMGTAWPESDFELERFKLRKAIPNASDRARVEGGNLATLLGITGG